MTELHQALAARITAWRDDGYRHDRFPVIAEILGYAFEDIDGRQLRYLRAAQFRAEPPKWSSARSTLGYGARWSSRTGAAGRHQLALPALRSPAR